jgi:hypothetical protein
VLEVPAVMAYDRRGTCTLAEAGGPEFLNQHGTLRDAFVAYQTAVADGFRALESAGLMQNVHFIDGARPRGEVSIAISAALGALPAFNDGTSVASAGGFSTVLMQGG